MRFLRGRPSRFAWLVAALSLLAACSPPLVRPPDRAEAPAPAAASPPPVATAPPVPDALVPGASGQVPWSDLRTRFAMQGCDYRPEVQRWARYYTQGTRAFNASLKKALPFLLLVSDEVARRDLPGEFALLPYLESTYQPIPSHGDRPAGMWQLVPDTARAAGLSVGADYDGRLDALASTDASLDLLSRYYREFADWRLADMAFNSGEYRVRKLLGERDARVMSADELSKLSFNRVTHEHLDRLLALACIVDDPRRFGVTLPEPSDEDHLQVVTLAAGMDLRLAARFSATDLGDLRRFNAGYRRNRMPDAALHRLLLPNPRVAQFQSASASVPQEMWSNWREEKAGRTSALATWASGLGIPVDVLATANALDGSATVLPNTRLLLPGLDARSSREADTAPAKDARVHIIIVGDTLSGVAHRYAIPLRQLKRMNPRASGTLRVGDTLRLDADAG